MNGLYDLFASLECGLRVLSRMHLGPIPALSIRCLINCR